MRNPPSNSHTHGSNPPHPTHPPAGGGQGRGGRINTWRGSLLVLAGSCLVGCLSGSTETDGGLAPEADGAPGLADARQPDARQPDAGDEPCAGGCITAPPPQCVSASTRRTYSAPGTCVDGTCVYPSSDEQCPFGCAGGDCQPDPCAGISCTTPPEATCVDDEQIRVYQSTGTCSGGECSYQSQVLPCTDLGEPAMCWEGTCYINPCGGCSDPPDSYCAWSYGTWDDYTAITYNNPGSCLNPETWDCYYSPSTTPCQEDCTMGVCHETPCSLGGYECNPPLGCKQAGPAELRCLPVDDVPEGFSCSAGVPGYRCANQMTCVWPDFVTTSVCAYLCASHADCAGVGLLDAHYCQPVPGSAYGYCV